METQFEISPTPPAPLPPVPKIRRLAPGMARPAPPLRHQVPSTSVAAAAASYRPQQYRHTNGVISNQPPPPLLQASTGMKLKPKVRPQMATRFTSTRTPSPPTLRPQGIIRTYPARPGPPGLRLLVPRPPRPQLNHTPRFPSPPQPPQIQRILPLPQYPQKGVIPPLPHTPPKQRPVLPPPLKKEMVTPPRPVSTRKPRNCAVKRTGGGLCPKPNVEPLGAFEGSQLEIEQVIMDDEDDDDPLSVNDEMMQRSMEIEDNDEDGEETHDLVVDTIEGRRQLKELLDSANGRANHKVSEMGPFDEDEVEQDIEFDTGGGQDPLEGASSSVARSPTPQPPPRVAPLGRQGPIIPIPFPLKREFPSPPHIRQQQAAATTTLSPRSEASSPPPPPLPPTELEHTLGELAKEYQNEEGVDEEENGDEMEVDESELPWRSPPVPVNSTTTTPSPLKKAKQTRKEQLVVNEFLADDVISFENDLIQDKLAR